MNEKKHFITILVTGPNGFIGTNLIERLCKEENFMIKAMVLKGTPERHIKRLQEHYNPEYFKKYGSNKLEIVYGDLLNPESLRSASENCDMVVHLAGLVTDWAPKEAFFELIEHGTQNLLDNLDESVNRFILMSSLTVHELNGHCDDTEDCERDMKSFPYGVAKKNAEDLVQKWADSSDGRDCAFIRPGFNIYGPHDKASFIKALDSLLQGKFGFTNKGKSLISYIYVENLVHGIVLMLEAEHLSGPYIISDGNMSWYDFIKSWVDKADVKMPKMSVPYWFISPFVWLLENIYRLFRIKKRPILTMYNIRIMRNDLSFSTEKARNELNYKPIISYDESLERTLKYYRENYNKQ